MICLWFDILNLIVIGIVLRFFIVWMNGYMDELNLLWILVIFREDI